MFHNAKNFSVDFSTSWARCSNYKLNYTWFVHGVLDLYRKNKHGFF